MRPLSSHSTSVLYGLRWRHLVLAGVIAIAPVSQLYASELESASVEQFRSTVAQMQQLASGCATDANACDAKKANSDQIVTAPHIVTMHWDWLRSALLQARKAKPEERAALMQDCEARLDEISRQIAANTAGENSFNQARHKADAILAGDEFQATHPTSAMDRFGTWLNEKINSFFEGMQYAANAAPWVGGLLEWGLFLGASALLLFFLFRNFTRQRTRVNFGDGALKLTAWDRESQDWAALAEESASTGNWREAVHNLYWAAIVHLEARRAWRHNPSRTPREYVRLLKAGSSQQMNLRSLTQIFERVWYGFDEAGSQEYTEARSFFNGLSQSETPSSPAEAA